MAVLVPQSCIDAAERLVWGQPGSWEPLTVTAPSALVCRASSSGNHATAQLKHRGATPGRSQGSFNKFLLGPSTQACGNPTTLEALRFSQTSSHCHVTESANHRTLKSLLLST